MRFSEFNEIFNPYDDKVYLSYSEYRLGGKKRFLSYDDIATAIKTKSVEDLEIGFELTDSLTLIETQDENLIKYIKDNKVLNTYIIKHKKDYQILFKKTSDDKMLLEYTTNVLTRASMKVANSRNKHTIVLPFKDPKTNKSSLLRFVTEEYVHNVEHLDPVPFELQPVVNKPYTNFEYRFPVTKNYIANMTSIINVLRPLVDTYEDVIHSIKSINDIFFDSPLSDTEIDELVDDENLVTKKFIVDGHIQYNDIANYVIRKLFVKYDEHSHMLFYYDEANSVYISDEKYIESYLYSLLPILKTTHIAEIIESIRRITYLERVKFNEKEFNVLFKNGLYQLEEDEFIEMHPDLYETNMIGATYLEEIPPNPFVDNFFRTLTLHDADVEKLLYEGIGYSMFRTNQYQKSFLCYGGGKNGKSTLFDLIKNVLGQDNVTKVSFKDLENTFRPAKLENKLASIAPDISSSEMSESDSMKSIISGDDVTIERKNKDSYDRPVYATMWFGANRLPRTPDNSYGFYRRFIVIPLKANLTHVKSGEGKLFYDELMKQENLDYVANKAVRAFANVHKVTNEFTMPAVVEYEIEYYKDTSDSVRQFMKDSLFFEDDPLNWPEPTAQYERYREWCKNKGYREKGYSNYESSWDLLKEEEEREREIPLPF